MNSEFEHILILFHYDSQMDGTMLMENTNGWYNSNEKQSWEMKVLISV